MFWRVVFEGAVFEYDKEPVYKVDDVRSLIEFNWLIVV